jgi:hypothetical protein
MNRHARRAARAMARHASNAKDHHLIAVHEAGHAVAKVLASGELGYAASEAIAYIEIGSARDGTVSADGKMLLRSQAVTFGPTFSREIADAAEEFENARLAGQTKEMLQGSDTRELYPEILHAARTAGADIGRWLRARVFDAVAGPLAEAIASNRQFGDVFWKGYAAEGDWNGIVSDLKISGTPVPEGFSLVNRMAVLAAYVMQDPLVWNAVIALAKRLPKAGRMGGSGAARIITDSMSEADLRTIFPAGLETLAKLEEEIAAASVVVATLPDGSKHLVKGKDHLAKHGEALLYECNLPVLAETLRDAFGDGSRPSFAAS